MIASSLAHLALRNRMLGTTVATTGSISLSATSTGYARASGSFLTDKFAVGMEITEVTGFSVSGNNQATTVQGRMITEISATAIACTGCATDVAAAGRVITAGVPFRKAFDNVKVTPTPGFPYLEEELVPAPSRVRTLPVAVGYAEDTGLYVVRWFGLSDTDILAIRRGVDAILARFTPATQFALSDGTTLRIPSENGPRAGQITRVEGGWSYCLLEIPYVGESINAVAA
jgi:hypothetical protein